MTKKLCIALFVGIALLLVLWQGAAATTNIDAAKRYAWNEAIGWIDFYGTGTVTVLANRLEGYATSATGYLALNCNTTPNGDICATRNFAVSNDGGGNLEGWAWDDGIGWVSFCGGAQTANCPGTVSYQVEINPSNGVFSGWAWSEAVGWISFNCTDAGICGTSNYSVQTSWVATTADGLLWSSVYDTGQATGVAPNSVLWQGTQPTDTSVRFQFSSSNCSNGKTNPPTCNDTGDWTYLGPDGTGATYYAPASPNLATMLNLANHNNKRYFRYKLRLNSNAAQTLTPTVDDVIINWSY
ncbi:MAG: hypothetical protein HYT14_00770 [Candidatus Liptonbacteria bacterium]|nr:hypothetical protein [Candidatus Liptonbacteria bacterium]